MADGKRQGSVSGTRVATPKIQPQYQAQGPGDLDDVLSKAIGAKVKLTTAAPHSQTFEGTIYTACRITNIIALNTAPPSSNASTPGDFHLIPIARIQSLNVVSLPSGNADEGTQPAIAKIDLKALKAREEAAIRKIRERDATRGKGVSREAQELFDALAKQYNDWVRWHETSIIVDNVMITQPYRPENCVAPKNAQHQGLLAHVKRIVENENRKFAQKAKAAAIPPPAMKKGG